MIKSIEIENITVLIQIKKIKHVYLRISQKGSSVCLSAPESMNQGQILDFLKSKIDWIKKHQNRFAKPNNGSEIDFTNVLQNKYYFKGVVFQLRQIDYTGKPKIVLSQDNYLNLYSDPNTSANLKTRMINNWYRQQMSGIMLPLVEKWQNYTGLFANEFRIKQMKTKWGTCNITAKRIWLNLELIKKPLHCLEFVIVHELVHLLERKHNSRFYTFMDQFMPEWKLYKKELDGFVD